MSTPPFLGRFWDALLGQSEKSTQTTNAAVLVNGTTIFRINGGPIIVTDLISYSTTLCDGTASTLQWSADGDVGAATTFTGASASLAAFAAGGAIVCSFVALSTAPIITGVTGVVLSGAVSTGVVIPAGIITTVVGVGSTTGKFLHYLRYKPMSSNSVVVAA